MRVVGGSARGKTLLVVPGHGTRPILDRVKTALFDVLRPRIEGLTMLDLFAGSGGVGIEALSQGAASCTFLDLGAKAVATIRKNLASTGLADRARVRHVDAFKFLKATDEAFDLIYVAPPQYKGLWVQALKSIAERPGLIRCDPDTSGVVIVQIDPREYQALELGELREVRQKRYGNSLLAFYEVGGGPNLEEPDDEE
jgi:16S rRNA (guanine966-N2)-methyltransferase